MPETGQAVAEDEGQAKLIYDRVNPGDEAAGSQLAAQENDPISDVPAQADESSNPISRVILPGGPGIDPPASETGPSPTATAAAPPVESESDRIQPIGPKKVRTVVVRPDGTIVSSEAAPADGSASSDAATSRTAASSSVGAGLDGRRRLVGIRRAADEAAPATPAPAGIRRRIPPNSKQPPRAAARSPGPATAIPLTETDPPSDVSSEPAQAAAEQIADPEPPAKPAKKATDAPRWQTARTSTADSDHGPPRLRPLAGGAMLVQVSSQRPEERRIDLPRPAEALPDDPRHATSRTSSAPTSARAASTTACASARSPAPTRQKALRRPQGSRRRLHPRAKR